MTKRNAIKNQPAAKTPVAATRVVVATPAAPRRTINTSALIAAAAGEVRQPTESGERVTVHIPKAFSLTLTDHNQVHYKAGTDEMPIEHAEHWYSKAMGVEVHDPKAK